MDLNFGYFLLSVLFVASAQGQNNQPNNTERFIADVNLHNSSTDYWGTLRCKAVAVTSRYFVTTATCATVRAPNWLSMQITHNQGRVEEIIHHPDYVAGNNTFANIAVMRWAHKLNTNTIPLRTLGGLYSNHTCDLFGFGSGASNQIPVRHAHYVWSPQFCDPSLPRVFCTYLTSTLHVSCGAVEGSPLVCSATSFDGILLNQDNCTAVGDNSYRLNYLSISEFREWIELVSAAESSTKVTAALILSAFAITFAKFVV